ncbi:MAG: hypothetical protein RRB24_10675 [Armatimonadota bacterium]|nr:hypothetical protein [Armatimonadota bacterium]
MSITTGGKGYGLVFLDRGFNPAAWVGWVENGGVMSVYNKDGKPAVSAGVIEGHGRVAIWNGKPQAVATMVALSFGGAIALTDENGKIVWTAP